MSAAATDDRQPGGHAMRVLCVGDVVGEEAARWLAGRIPRLRDEYGLDWVVVTAQFSALTTTQSRPCSSRSCGIRPASQPAASSPTTSPTHSTRIAPVPGSGRASVVLMR